MKKVYIPEQMDGEEQINLDDVGIYTPVFVKKDGKLVGMVVRNGYEWIIKLGGGVCATGYHENRLDCILSSLKHGYEFYVA